MAAEVKAGSTPMDIDGIPVRLIRKPVKHLRIRVVPPSGDVRVTAPLFMSQHRIREAVMTKRSWIARHQQRIRSATPAPCAGQFRYIDAEEHLLRGTAYPLKILKAGGKHRVRLAEGNLVISVRDPADTRSVARALERFYREELEADVRDIISRYKKLMGVTVEEVGIKKMRTRWGTCNPRASRIWVNYQLAMKPPKQLEYLVVHEMVHLLEPSHNARFKALMDEFLPDWRAVRKYLQ